MPVLNFPLMKEFRQKFVLTNTEKIKWFPGHMAGGLKKMQQKLSKVDCIIEVHDARIPLSGRNPNFKLEVLGVKPHILVLNKMDLASERFQQPVIDYITASEKVDSILYTNCKKERSAEIKNVVPTIKDVISRASRYNRSENREYGVMVIGVPNVGKSSLINAMRAIMLKKGRAAPVGARAGITKAVQTRIRISNEPPVFIYDTPGIMTPNIPTTDVGLKLALCACFQDHMVGVVTMADYLLYQLNKNFNYCYMDYFGINEPCDDIYILLAQDSIKKSIYSVKRMGNVKERIPDLENTARLFLEAFRSGRMGTVFLDADCLP